MLNVLVHAAHHRCVCVCKCVCINAGLSGIRSVRYRNKKTNDAGTGSVPDQAKAVRHFLVRYQTEIIDAEMPVLVSWMPIPSYVHKDEPPEAVVIVAALSSYFTKAPLK
jgi:hypothetical protein